MIHIVLYQPEIPPNTGNLIRLYANTGFPLHLIEPLGFELSDKHLKRASLDYTDRARMQVHPSLETFIQKNHPNRLSAVSTKGKRLYSDVHYEPGDALLFGPETSGLPSDLLNSYPTITIPMKTTDCSLNLSNAVAIVVYEAWKQLEFM